MFSWSKSSSNDYPGTRQAQTIPGSVKPPSSSITRQQHINSYLNDKTLAPSTRRVSVDDSTYDTVFQTTAGDALILRVRIPPSDTTSSCKAPIMTLVGVKAQHSWIDNRMNVVGYDPITSDEKWVTAGPTPLLLNKAVNTVVQQFQLHPPTIIQITDPGLKRIQPKSKQQQRGSTSGSNRTSQQQQQQQHSSSNGHSNNGPPGYDTLTMANKIPDINLPEIPSHYDNELNSLSRKELENMLNNELDFVVFRNKKIKIFDELKRKEYDIIKKNVKTAEENLDKKESLKTLHTECIDLKEKLGDKVNAYNKLEKEQNQLIEEETNINKSKQRERDIIQRLIKAKRSTLKESDELAIDWIDEYDDSNAPNSNVDAFIKKFLKIRTDHHMYAAKAERLERTAFAEGNDGGSVKNVYSF